MNVSFKNNVCLSAHMHTADEFVTQFSILPMKKKPKPNKHTKKHK